LYIDGRINEVFKYQVICRSIYFHHLQGAVDVIGTHLVIVSIHFTLYIPILPL